MMEHSCTPNACYQFENDKLIVLAAEVIPSGTGIAISYIDLYQSLEDRTQQLKERYHFQCSCMRCGSDLFNRDRTRAFTCDNCKDSGIVTPIHGGHVEADWACDKCKANPSPERMKQLLLSVRLSSLVSGS